MPSHVALLAVTAALATPALGVSAEYKRQADSWRKTTTRSEFFRLFNEDRKGVDEVHEHSPRADRLWAYIEEQLEHGGVVFKESGDMMYALPMTHFVPLPDFFLDVIEVGIRPLRKVYSRFLVDVVHEDAHQILHEFVEWLQETGVHAGLHVVAAGLLGFSCLQWLIYRFTDGIWPSERKLAKETKRLAQDYLKKKNA